MKQAIQYSNKYIGVVDKQMTKAITQFAHKKWQKAYDLFHFNNEKDEANLLTAFGKLYCAAQLESSSAPEDAHILLNHTNFEFWAYLEEHNFPRYARRFAYHFLAYTEAENNNNEDALNYIEEALYISSPIDKLDNVPLLEQKVQICLATNEKDLAYFSIQKIQRLDAENDTFQEIINSTNYKNYLEMNNLDKLKKGIENETAKEALDRYQQFLNLYFQDDEDEMKEYAPYFFGKISEKEILIVEKELQFTFPPSYRDFVLKYGLFNLGENQFYESRLLASNEMSTLLHELKKEWQETYEGYNTEIQKEFDRAVDLIPFSYGDEGLQSVWFYCFDKRSLNPKTGEMSVYHFNQDEWDFDALPICENNGFDKHISKLIDKQIEYLLD